MAINRSVREIGWSVGVGVLYALLGVFWLVRGDERPVGIGFLLIAVGNVALAVLPRSTKVQLAARAVVVVAGAAVVVWALLADR